MAIVGAPGQAGGVILGSGGSVGGGVVDDLRAPVTGPVRSFDSSGLERSGAMTSRLPVSGIVSCAARCRSYAALGRSQAGRMILGSGGGLGVAGPPIFAPVTWPVGSLNPSSFARSSSMTSRLLIGVVVRYGIAGRTHGNERERVLASFCNGRREGADAPNGRSTTRARPVPCPQLPAAATRSRGALGDLDPQRFRSAQPGPASSSCHRGSNAP